MDALKNASKEQLLLALAYKIKQTCPDDATKFTVEITADGIDSFITTTGQGFLLNNKTNMRNLRGEWIV